jgi:hypothetical protein
MNNEYINPYYIYPNSRPNVVQAKQTQEELGPIFMFIFGFFCPCIWLFNYCIYRSSKNKSTNTIVKLSLMMFLTTLVMNLSIFIIIFMYLDQFNEIQQ